MLLSGRARFWVPPLALVIVCTLLFGLMVAHMLRTLGSDYQFHVDYARGLVEGSLDRSWPHILYQVCIIGLTRLVPFIDYTVGGLIVSLVFYQITALILYFPLRAVLGGERRWLAALLSLTLLLASAILLPGSEVIRYLAYIIPNAHHNPTMILLKPLALLLFWYSVDALNGKAQWSLQVLAVGITLTMLATFAKPNFTLSLVPALIVIGLMQLRHRCRVELRLLAFGVIVPTLLLLGLQYALAYGVPDDSDIVLAPFAVALLYGGSFEAIFIKLLLSIAFPLAVFVLYAQAVARETGVMLAWLTFEVGAAQWFLLAETGYRAAHANFTWSAQIGLFVLFTASMLFLLKQRSRAPRWRFVVCMAIFAAHFVSGIVFFIAFLSWQGFGN